MTVTEGDSLPTYVLRVAVWELTLACNLNCLHCGSKAGRKRGQELTTDEALDLCRALGAEGLSRLTLSGGEPLLRQDWPLLARTLTDLGVQVNMVSNGQAFSRETALVAIASGLKNIAFSLDGLEESHTFLRRNPGNWKKIMENFQHCREVGLSSAAITTVHRGNFRELPAIRELLREAGVALWQLQLATPSGNMGDHRDIVLQPADLLEVIPLIARLRKLPSPPRIDVGDNIGYFGGYEQELRGGSKDPDVPFFWMGCNAGLCVVGIESDGAIKGCLSLPSSKNDVDAFIEGTIRERSFHDIWHDPNAFAYNRRFTMDLLQGFCRTCEYAELCRGGCSWLAFAHTGTRFETSLCLHRVVEEARAKAALETSASEADLMKVAREAIEGERLGEAETALDTLLRENPTHLQALDLLGYVRFFQQRYAEAEACCRRALTLAPDNAYSHKGLGLCLWKLGRADEGLTELEEAIRLKPDWRDPYWDMAVVLTDLGRLDEASRAIDRGSAQVTGGRAVFKPLLDRIHRS